MPVSFSRSLDPVIVQLRRELNGRVLTPEDSDYDDARRVFYGGLDRRPSAIVYAAHEGDVSRVVKRASENRIELAVRSGGHSIAGHSVSDGGIVIDLREMKAVSIDANDRTATAQAGLTAEEFTAAAGTHGLAVGFGDTGSVGIGGITLGGGVGISCVSTV
jgi:FAD/FMN-containing dehydrogenase